VANPLTQLDQQSGKVEHAQLQAAAYGPLAHGELSVKFNGQHVEMDL